MFDLDQRIAVITGSSHGIGRATAEQMAQAGARVVVSSRNAKACDAVVEGIVKGGGEAIAVPCHIGHKDELQNLVDTTLSHWGRIDILVCNAAINPAYGPMAEMTDEVFHKIIDTNVGSAFRLCNMVLPGMAERGQGSVILMSSITAFAGNTMIGLYGVSKAAKIQLARNLAVEWGHRGIRVNCIAPGLIKTEFARALWDNPALRSQVEQRTPLGRIGTPADISGVAVFLASDAAAFMTGQTLTVDGGVMISDPL